MVWNVGIGRGIDQDGGVTPVCQLDHVGGHVHGSWTHVDDHQLGLLHRAETLVDVFVGQLKIRPQKVDEDVVQARLLNDGGQAAVGVVSLGQKVAVDVLCLKGADDLLTEGVAAHAANGGGRDAAAHGGDGLGASVAAGADGDLLAHLFLTHPLGPQLHDKVYI